MFFITVWIVSKCLLVSGGGGSGCGGDGGDNDGNMGSDTENMFIFATPHCLDQYEKG
jgi:hypothetical protein